MCVCMCVSVCACVYVFLYVCIHTYLYVRKGRKVKGFERERWGYTKNLQV